MKHPIQKNRFPIALVILDGFGHSTNKEYNALAQAKTPNLDYLLAHYPHTTLKASGEAVGLFPGIMGNSEVGHLTIGAGKIVEQELVRISNAIKDGSFFSHTVLQHELKQLATKNKALHCIGLVSNGSVHSHIDHLKAFLRAAKQAGITDCYVHAFLDGRDVAPQSSIQFLTELTQFMKDEQLGEIASICGRVYGMDRNENWQRTEKAYTLLTKKSDKASKDWHATLNEYYNHGIFDEFIPPTQINPEGIINNGDGIIFFNFRPDRARQLTEAFTNPSFNNFPTKKLDLSFFITPTDYKSNRCRTTILFPHTPIKNSLKELLSDAGYSVFTCAETEKYAHVTYFFGGGTEKKFPGETRVMLPSLDKKSFIDHPEMSAKKITAAVVTSLETNPHDFYLINYANADMVAHSGSLSATIKAVECLDEQIGILFKECVEKKSGTLIITSDHGNAENMYDEKNKQPLTSHTTNPVPFIVVNKELYDASIKLPLKGLAGVAPFITQLFTI